MYLGTRLVAAALPCLLIATPVAAVTVDLFGWAVNVGGTFSEPTMGDPIPTEVDAGGFNQATGLGQLRITVTGAGSHYVGAFFDHEIDNSVPGNSFFNETGATDGSAASGQSWEIDEPGFVNGDIYENLQLASLDNGIGTSIYGDTAFPDDVSMAMAWDFTLAAGETGIVDFFISDLQPSPGGLVLSQTDPLSDYTLFLSGTLLKRLAGAPAIPEPTTLILYSLGLAGIVGLRRVRA